MKIQRQLKKLLNICDLITDGSHFSPKTIEEGYPYITVKDIDDKGDIDFLNSKKISLEDFNSLGNSNCAPKKGDILLSKDGTVGKIALVKNEGFVVLSSLAIIRSSKNLNNQFLKYFFQSPEFMETALASKTGAAIKRIVLKTIKDFQIPLPPLATQQKIVAKLDEVSATITQSKTQIENQLSALEECWQSSLSEAFDNDEGETKMIDEISHKIQYGYTGKTIEKGKVRYLRITDIQNDYVDWDSVPFVDISEDEIKKYQLNTGDIVFARTGATVGKSFLINNIGDDKIFASYLIRIVPNYTFIQPEYLKYFFQSKKYRNQIYADVVGAAQPNFNGKKLGDIQIPLPPVSIQKEIVAHLDQLHENISTLKQQYQTQLTHYDELRASVLDQAFKGELVEE